MWTRNYTAGCSLTTQLLSQTSRRKHTRPWTQWWSVAGVFSSALDQILPSPCSETMFKEWLFRKQNVEEVIITFTWSGRALLCGRYIGPALYGPCCQAPTSAVSTVDVWLHNIIICIPSNIPAAANLIKYGKLTKIILEIWTSNNGGRHTGTGETSSSSRSSSL